MLDLPSAHVHIAAGTEEALCEWVDLAGLPPDWTASPAPASNMDLGTAWVHAGTSAVLVVPSALVPQGRLFRPHAQHPDFSCIRIGSAAPFAFDPAS
jgi:RES domain-containing protein